MGRRTFTLLLLLASLGHALTALAQPAATADGRTEAEAVKFVQQFFAALDARDVDRIRASFVDGAKVISDTGAITEPPDILRDVREAKEWPPRTRELSSFETRTVGDVLIVGCLNRVVMRPAGRPPVEQTFYETWVLQRTGAGLKALRAHYSRVTAAPR